jgi:hypothetical protein
MKRKAPTHSLAGTRVPTCSTCSIWPPPWLIQTETKLFDSPKLTTAAESSPPSINLATAHICTESVVTEAVAKDRLDPAKANELKTRLESARRKHFQGKLPESLERVAAIYLELAQEQPDTDFTQALDLAISNAVTMLYADSMTLEEKLGCQRRLTTQDLKTMWVIEDDTRCQKSPTRCK